MTHPDDPVYPKTGELNTGLSIREYMATAIYAGFCACPIDAVPEQKPGQSLADVAVQWADQLVAALNKPQVKS